MPTYDYVCDACGHEYELFQSIKAGPEKKCPKCRKNKLRRLIGPGAAIIFKGSGFYQTDYRSKSYTQGAEAAKKARSEADASSGSKGKDKSKKKATSDSK